MFYSTVTFLVMLFAVGARATGLLRRQLVARITLNGNSGSMVFKDMASMRDEGVVMHELFHAGALVAGYPRSVPMAAAIEYVTDYTRTPNAPISLRVRELVQSHARHLLEVGRDSFERQAAGDIDRIASKYGNAESPQSYEDGIRLAALVIALLSDRATRGDGQQPVGHTEDATAAFLSSTEGIAVAYLWDLAIGAGSELALRAARDAQLRDVVLDAGHSVEEEKLLEDTFLAAPRMSDADILGIRAVIDGRRDPFDAERAREAFQLGLRRARENDRTTIYELGSRITTEAALGDGPPNDRLPRWGTDRTIVKLNSRLEGNRQKRIAPGLVTLVRDSLPEIADKVRPAREVTVETGNYSRNTFEDGTIFIQWSGLISREAEARVLFKKHEISGALISINASCTYDPVIVQQLVVALFGLHRYLPTTVDWPILHNPLVRPRALFDAPAYRHFASAGSSLPISSEHLLTRGRLVPLTLFNPGSQPGAQGAR